MEQKWKEGEFWKMVSTIGSLWMECCQFALRVWTETQVFKFPVTVLVAVLVDLLPLYTQQNQQFQNRKVQDIYLQSSCHILTSSSGSQVQRLRIWKPGVHSGSYTAKCICSSYCKHFMNLQSWTSVLCHGISSF